METLKPCPFCGEQAFVDEELEGNFIVGCLKKANCCGEQVASPVFHSEEEAIKAWNTRVDPYFDALPMTEENMRASGWVRERTCKMRLLIHMPGHMCEDIYKCSECGEMVERDTHIGESEPPSYCPNCGAKVVNE